ncbi:MAG: Sec-independent protein translocase protein TatB, partial [Arenimonas sp.]
MFDVGFSELLIIAVVALLVLGPERLPKAARFAGLWVRRARAQWYSVKAEFEREIAQEELMRQVREPFAEAMAETGAQMRALDAELSAPYVATKTLAAAEFEDAPSDPIALAAPQPDEALAAPQPD